MDTTNTTHTSILYLDTQLEFAKIFSRLLESADYSITHYSNLEQVSQNHTHYDLILCELKLFRHRLFPRFKTQKVYTRPCLVFASHLSAQDKLWLHQHAIIHYFERTENFKIILDKINTATQQ